LTNLYTSYVVDLCHPGTLPSIMHLPKVL